MTIDIEVYEKARERFDYNPLTGDIIYIENTERSKIGDIVECINGRGYIMLHYRKKALVAHRLAFYIMEGHLPENIDHINGVRTDNRWANLRACTKGENSRNRGMSKANKSGYRGVSKHQGRWRGRVNFNGVEYSKYGYDTPELANEWVLSNSKKLYGEFYNESRLK